MEDIKVQLIAPAKEDLISYVRDPQIEEDILFISRRTVIPGSYSINVNGIVQIVLDADSTILAIECLYPRKKWTIDKELSLPDQITPANLKFVMHRRGRYLELPVRITTDEDYKFAQVLIGNPGPNIIYVGLSDQCYGIVSGNNFQGYFVHLT